MMDTGQTLRVTDEEVTSRHESIGELPDELLLSRTIEIDHHIAAKNKLKRLLEGIGGLEEI